MLLVLAATTQVFRASAAWQMLQGAEALGTAPRAADALALGHRQQALAALNATRPFEGPLLLALIVAVIVWFRYLDRSRRGLGATLAAFLIPGVNLVVPFLWLRRIARTAVPSRAWLVDASWLAVVAEVLATGWSWLTYRSAMGEISRIVTGSDLRAGAPAMATALTRVGTGALVASGLALLVATLGAVLVWSIGNAPQPQLPDRS